MKLRTKPHYIFLEATTRCQLSCPGCMHGRGTVESYDVGVGDIKVSEWTSLLGSNPRIRGVEVGSWGEPLLHKDIRELIRHADSRGVKVTINSNLNVRKDGLMSSLVDSHVRRVMCSIDGASQETYEIYRVGGSFDAILENAAEVRDAKRRAGTRYPRMIWKFIIFGHNEHEVAKAREMASELDMEFMPAMPSEMDMSVGRPIDLTYSPPRDKDLLQRELGWTDFKAIAQQLGYEPLTATCWQLWEQIALNWNGDVLGCCGSQKKTGGNAFREGLMKAANHPDICYAREMVTGRKPPRKDIGCADCHVYKTIKANGTWVRRTLENKAVRAYVERFGMPEPKDARHARAMCRIQRNAGSWSSSVIIDKFS